MWVPRAPIRCYGIGNAPLHAGNNKEMVWKHFQIRKQTRKASKRNIQETTQNASKSSQAVSKNKTFFLGGVGEQKFLAT